jgi:hypothetical protein
MFSAPAHDGSSFFPAASAGDSRQHTQSLPSCLVSMFGASAPAG